MSLPKRRTDQREADRWLTIEYLQGSPPRIKIKQGGLLKLIDFININVMWLILLTELLTV